MYRERMTENGMLIYYATVGGHIDQGETPYECAARECLEETGQKIRAVKLCYDVEETFWKKRQAFFLCEKTGGEFGTGAGEEFQEGLDPKRGIYRPALLTLEELKKAPFKPDKIKAALAEDWEKYGETLSPEVKYFICE